MLFVRSVLSSRLRAMSSGNKSLYGIVFDMDGTLTVPCLDFKKLRQILGLVEGTDILSHVSGLSDVKKKEAMTVIEKFEEEGRENLQVQPGLKELLEFLGGKSGLHLGLLTRNSAEAVDHFILKCRDLGICAEEDNPFSIVGRVL